MINFFFTERSLEDHEDILAVHRELEMFTSDQERRFYFREDFLKYELFVNPKVSAKSRVILLSCQTSASIFIKSRNKKSRNNDEIIAFSDVFINRSNAFELHSTCAW